MGIWDFVNTLSDGQVLFLSALLAQDDKTTRLQGQLNRNISVWSPQTLAAALEEARKFDPRLLIQADD